MRALAFALVFAPLLACEAPTSPLDPGLAVRPDAGCTAALSVQALGRLVPEAASARPAGMTAALGAEGLYFAENVGGGGRISRWTGGDHVEPLSEATPSWQMSVLGGGDGAVAWARTRDGAEPTTEVFLAAAGESRELARTSAVLAPTWDPAFVHAVEGGRAAYVTSATLEVAGVGLEQPYATLLALHPAEPPFLRWPFVVLTGYDGRARRIIAYDLSASWRSFELVGDGLRSAALVEGALFYLDGEVPMRAKLGEVLVGEPLMLGPCSSLDTDGERVVFACDPQPAAIGGTPVARHRSLWLYEGGTLRALDLGGRLATLPRVRGELVAYLAYDETDFCAERGLGRVVVQRLADGATVEVGQLTHGCYCCDAYWPIPELLFEGDLLAWSYDVTDVAEPTTVGWGLARVATACP